MCTLTSSAIATADNFRCWFAEIMPMVLAADISPVQLTACCGLWFFGMNSQYQVCRRIGDDYKVIETYFFQDDNHNETFAEAIMIGLKAEETTHKNFLALLTTYASLLAEYDALSSFQKSASKVSEFISTVKTHKEIFGEALKFS